MSHFVRQRRLSLLFSYCYTLRQNLPPLLRAFVALLERARATTLRIAIAQVDVAALVFEIAAGTALLEELDELCAVGVKTGLESEAAHCPCHSQSNRRENSRSGTRRRRST